MTLCLRYKHFDLHTGNYDPGVKYPDGLYYAKMNASTDLTYFSANMCCLRLLYSFRVPISASREVYDTLTAILGEGGCLL